MRQKAMVLAIIAVLLLFGAMWYNRSQTVMAGARDTISGQLSSALGGEVAIGRVEIAAINKLVLHEVFVRNELGQEVLRCSSVRVTFSPVALLMGKATVQAVKTLELDRPEMSLRRGADGRWNIQNMIERAGQDGPRFGGVVAVQGGTLAVAMPEGELELAAIDGEINLVHKDKTAVMLSARCGEERFTAAGCFGDDGSGAVEINGSGLSIDRLKRFAPADLAVKPKSGRVGKFVLTVRRDAGKTAYSGEARLIDAALEATGVELDDINGQVAFTEKYVYLFDTKLKVYGQDIEARGKIGIDTAEPTFNLAVAADRFDPAALGRNIPLAGQLQIRAIVTGTAARPAVSGEFKLAAGSIAGYDAVNAAARIDYADARLDIQQFDAAMFGGQVSAAGVYDTSDQGYRFDVSARGLDMAMVPAIPAPVGGHGDFDIVVWGKKGGLGSPDLKGTARMGAGQIAGVSFTGLNGGFSKTGADIELEYLTVGFGQGSLTAKGSVTAGKADIAFFGQGVPLASAAAAAGGIDLAGAADFEGKIGGTLDAPQVTAGFTAQNGRVFYQPFSAARGTVALRNNMLILDDVEATNGAGRHFVRGTAGLSGERLLDMTVQTAGARAEDLVKLVLPGEKLTGNVDHEMRLTGPLHNFSAEGRIKLWEGSFRGQLVTRAEGRYHRKNGVLTLSDFTVSALNAEVRLDGAVTADSRLDFNVVARDIDIAALHISFPYPVSGRVNFTGKLTGTPANPLFGGEIASPAITLNNQQLQNIAGRLSINGEQVDIEHFGFAQGAGKFDFSGGCELASKTVYGEVNAVNGSVASLLAVLNAPAKGVDGRLNGHVTLGGTLSQPDIRLTGTLRDGKIRNYPLESIDADVALQNNVLTINRFEARQGGGLLAVRGKAALNGPLDLEVGGRGLDAGLLTAWFESNIETTGKLNFAAQISGTTASPYAAVSLDIAGGGVANANFDALYGLFILDKGSIHVNQVMLTKGPYRASAYGVVPLGALSREGRAKASVVDQMDLTVRLEQANLSILPLLTKEVAWATGETKGEINIGGTLAQPTLSGGITVKDGAVKLASLADPIQKVGVDIEFEGDKINIKSFDGSMGQGQYRMTGTAAINGVGLSNYKLFLVLDQLGVNHKYFKGPVSGTLNLDCDPERPRLSGQIVFENTTLNIPYLPEVEPSGPDVGLDLEILAGKKVRLYNPYLYDMVVEGRVKLAGSLLSPAASGRIEAVRGQVSYLSTRFKISNGTADFIQAGSFIPVVRLDADARLEQTRVRLAVRGPINQMNVRLTSEPVMSQNEIVTLLTLRSRYFDKRDSSGGDRDAGLGRDEVLGLLETGLQMRFVAEAESAFRDYFGLDEFRLIRGSDADSPGQRVRRSETDREFYSIEMSKYLNDRLLLSYSRGIDNNRYTASVRYDLTRRWSISGFTDEQKRYWLGIETRFKF